MTSRGCFPGNTHENWVKNARDRWGDRFDYPERYEHSGKRMEIICREHGSFHQEPRKHTEGIKGCKPCSLAARAETYRRKHEKIFLRRAREIYGDRYRYHLVRYVHSKREVVIVCRKHGPFPQTPSNHT